MLKNSNFWANNAFFNTKVVTFKKIMKKPYEIRSVPAGKVPKINKHAGTFIP